MTTMRDEKYNNDRLIQMTGPRHALCLVLFSVKMNGGDDDDGDDHDEDDKDGLEISLCEEGEI